MPRTPPHLRSVPRGRHRRPGRHHHPPPGPPRPGPAVQADTAIGPAGATRNARHPPRSRAPAPPTSSPAGPATSQSTPTATRGSTSSGCSKPGRRQQGQVPDIRPAPAASNPMVASSAPASRARARPCWRSAENAYHRSSSPGQRSRTSLNRRNAPRPEMAISSRSARPVSRTVSMNSAPTATCQDPLMPTAATSSSGPWD
jgi:hypothetical protein